MRNERIANGGDTTSRPTRVTTKGPRGATIAAKAPGFAPPFRSLLHWRLERIPCSIHARSAEVNALIAAK